LLSSECDNAPREFNFNLLDTTTSRKFRDASAQVDVSFAERNALRSRMSTCCPRTIQVAVQLKRKHQERRLLNEIIPASAHNIQIRRYQEIADFST